jgi:hypothetical protein
MVQYKLADNQVWCAGNWLNLWNRLGGKEDWVGFDHHCRHLREV